MSRARSHECDDCLAFLRVGATHDRGFCHRLVRYEGRLDLVSRDAMACDVHDVIDAAQQPVVAFLVELGTVTCKVSFVPVSLEIGLAVAVVIAEDCPHHGRRRSLQDQITTRAQTYRVSFFVHHVGADAGEGHGGGTRLELGDAGQSRDHYGASLRLPPGVDHGSLASADELLVPDPRYGIDRLADASQ